MAHPNNRDFAADSDAVMGRSGTEFNSGSIDSMKDSVQRSSSQIGGKVRELAHTAQEQAGEQVRTQLDTGRTRAASALRDVANSLMHPNEEGADPVSRYIRTAGDQVQRAADYLERTDVRQLTRDAESFARRNPAVFLGSAFALGLIAARVLKSTRHTDGASMQQDRLYDRETSLNSFREPQTQYGGASLGSTERQYNTTSDAMLGGPSTLGDVSGATGSSSANRSSSGSDLGTSSTDSDLDSKV